MNTEIPAVITLSIRMSNAQSKSTSYGDCVMGEELLIVSKSSMTLVVVEGSSTIKAVAGIR